ncbi:hypothetical protein V6N13_149752 [Hibiscus sabdariffa]|uniref:Protein kinase domain-containing protein n=1 Tax=Hibiscus sabdariffa TaxID=183260 RepID=A0ABR2EGE6_9ROSI
MLNPILHAAESQQGICGEEVCGNVTIPSPFGIHHNCYTLPWFRVTCEENKPFINVNGINLEVLGSFFDDTINVNYPVTPVNCSRRLNITGDDIDLAGTPFFLSGSYNFFGSVGCGNLATISANRLDSIVGCMQPMCGSGGGSGPGCFTQIFGNITSYTVSMADMHGGKTSCASAFMFCSSYFENGYPLPVEINSETTHVPATLEWDSSYCSDEGCEAPRPTNLIDQKSCGSLSFEYPFGVRNQSHSETPFEVICNETGDGERTPFLNLNGTDVQILDFSFLHGTVLVNHSITYFNCRGNNDNGMSLNLKGTRFYYSDIHNAFWSSGCGNRVTVFDQGKGNFIGGCSQPSCRIQNETSSTTGCRIIIPRGLNSFFINMSDGIGSSDYSRKRSCGFASPIYSELFYNLTDSTIDFDLNNWTYVPASLQWGTPIRASCQLSQGPGTSCSSDGTYCWRALNYTHLCVCAAENLIGQGTYCEGKYCGDYRWCHILCLNTPDNYCLSPARRTAKPLNFKIIMIGCITSIVSISLLVAVWQIHKAWKKRQDIKLKQKYFKRNGGLLLQKHLSSNEGSVEKIKLYTSKEMEKATDSYNKNRILGQGGQGTVYKGMLTDGRIVAVKKSKMLEGNRFDEKKVEQFINEVIILSQINHRNVVKLLGCCLEAEVPLLVYEFIQNGTLYDLIHYQTEEFPLTWEMRLRIAIEIANALFYLHSAASVSIYHRDIKSSNILLDDKYRAKVSDFGTSRSIALEKTHLTTGVQGTFGYMDPEYFRSNQFTEKSDVYSFGVVLVELLTGRKPILSDQTEEERSLISYFLRSMQEDTLFNILDSTIVNDSPEKDIKAMAKLVKRCLNLNGKRRPTMKQVAMELELIKASKADVDIEEGGDEESETDDIIESWNANLSWSTSISITTESTTLPLNPTF